MLRLRRLLPSKALAPGAAACLWLRRPAAHAAALGGPTALLLRQRLGRAKHWLAVLMLCLLLLLLLLLLGLLCLAALLIIIESKFQKRLEAHRGHCR